jgi:hypothetical protein
MHRVARVGMALSWITIAFAVAALVATILEFTAPDPWRHALAVAGAVLGSAACGGFIVVWGVILTRGRLWEREEKAR